MKMFLKVLGVILWTIVAMIIGNLFGESLPIRIMLITAAGIVLFFFGVLAGRASKNNVALEDE